MVVSERVGSTISWVVADSSMLIWSIVVER